jgi:alpha-beta hydrolase superfamily lysophospholipase
MYNFFSDNYWWTIRVNGIINESYLGGGSYGEIVHVIEKLNTKEPGSWVREWEAMGEKVRGLAQDADAEGILPLSKDRYLRASNYYQLGALSMHHHDPRMTEVYKKSVECFHRGIKSIPHIEMIKVPYENSYLPGYFVNSSQKGEKRPVVVIVDGVHGTAEKMFFVLGRVCPEYGLSALCLDGPGNGGSILLNGLRSRYDSEVQAKAVFDFLQTRSDVDTRRVALISPSLGGYYAARAVAFEKRYAACVIYGAVFDYGEIWAGRPDDHEFASLLMWILGVDSIAAAREKVSHYNLRGVAELIECPTLILQGENDRQVPISHTYRIYEALRCPKKLRIFAKEDGGDEHCQQDDLGVMREAVFSWLTSTLSLNSS